MAGLDSGQSCETRECRLSWLEPDQKSRAESVGYFNEEELMTLNHDIRVERLSALLLVAGLFAFITNPVEGSQPVRKVIVGCVVNGALISSDGYHIRVRDAATREELRLDRYEGMRVRIRGQLLPGDNHFIQDAPRVLGRCTK